MQFRNVAKLASMHIPASLTLSHSWQEADFREAARFSGSLLIYINKVARARSLLRYLETVWQRRYRLADQ